MIRAKLKNIQIFLKAGSANSRMIGEVSFVCDIAKYLDSDEFEGIITPYIDSNSLFFVWVRMYFEDGSSQDSPIAHFLGSMQVSPVTYRALYDATNR